MKKFSSVLILLTILIFCNACAEQVDLEFPESMTEYGFFSGLWHGFIAPFSLIGMFFGLDVVVFAIKNTGFFYALGFLLGSGGWGILASKAKKSNK